MIPVWILSFLLVTSVFADNSCNYHFQPTQDIQDFLEKSFGKYHTYEAARISDNWSFLDAPPKAYVNQVELKPMYSYVDLPDLTGEEIILRSNLTTDNPQYLDTNKITGEGFYHGDDVEPALIKNSGGFKQRNDTQIVDRDLIHHAAGESSISRYAEGTPVAELKIRSGFMGTTITPLDMNNDGSWGKYIYDFRGVPGWDLQRVEGLAVSDLDRSVMRSVSGEREIVVPRDIPVWCLLRVATTVTSSATGRTRISKWDINPDYNPLLCRKYFAR